MKDAPEKVVEMMDLKNDQGMARKKEVPLMGKKDQAYGNPLNDTQNQTSGEPTSASHRDDKVSDNMLGTFWG